MTRATWTRTGLIAVAVTMSQSVGAGCNNKQSAPPRETSASAMPPTSRPMHSVQVRQLKPLMQVLLQTTSTRWPKTLPTDVEQPVDPAAQQKAYDQAATLADELTIAAGQIPAVVGGKSLPEDLRAGFLAEAAALKSQAVELKANATQKRAESMSRNLDAINATCINCHSKYRDLTGNVDPMRALGNERNGASAERRIAVAGQ